MVSTHQVGPEAKNPAEHTWTKLAGAVLTPPASLWFLPFPVLVVLVGSGLVT